MNEPTTRLDEPIATIPPVIETTDSIPFAIDRLYFRVPTPGGGGYGPDFDSLEAAVHHAREWQAAYPESRSDPLPGFVPRAFVDVREKASIGGTGYEKTIRRYEILAAGDGDTAVILVPEGQGGLSDGQREAVLEAL